MSVRRVISFLATVVLLSASVVSAQTHAVLLPENGSEQFEPGTVYPMSIIDQYMQDPMPPAILPLEGIASFPSQERAGKRVVLVSPQVNVATPIWEVQLQGPPVDSIPEEDEWIPVEQQPEFDQEALVNSIVYPAQAAGERREGTVIVGALIGVEGFVERVQIIRSDDPVFNGAAAAAVAMTPFTPGVAKGKPTRLWVRIPVKFKLD